MLESVKDAEIKYMEELQVVYKQFDLNLLKARQPYHMFSDRKLGANSCRPISDCS